MIKATYNSMMKAISIVKDGIHLGDIGSAIQTHVEKEDSQLSKIFAAMELEKLFIKSLMFCIMVKKELVKKLEQE